MEIYDCCYWGLDKRPWCVVVLDETVDMGEISSLFSTYLSKILGCEVQNERTFVREFNKQDEIVVKYGIKKNGIELTMHLNNTEVSKLLCPIDFFDIDYYESIYNNKFEILVVPTVIYSDSYLSSSDLFMAPDLCKLQANNLIVSPKIRLDFISNFEGTNTVFRIVNSVIVFSGLVLLLYYMLSMIMCTICTRLVDRCKKAFYIKFNIDSEYILLRELYKEYSRWKLKLDKLDNFLSGKIYASIGKYIDHIYFSSLKDSMFEAIYLLFNELDKYIEETINDARTMYTNKVSERTAMVNTLIGWVLGLTSAGIGYVFGSVVGVRSLCGFVSQIFKNFFRILRGR